MEWYDPLQEKKGGATKVKVPEIGKKLPLPLPMYRYICTDTDTVTYVPAVPLTLSPR
jgi:hypothetical protein